MNYHESARTRKTGLSTLILNKLMSGGSVGSSIKGALSDRMQSSMMGLKERFDPLNIASKLTGGSKIGPALLGKMTGRSKEDIDYFANRKRIHRFDNVMNQGHGSGDSRKATEVLENIYSFMVKTRESQIKDNHSSFKFENERQQANQRRHDEVMNVFTEATKRNRQAVGVIAKPKAPEAPPAAPSTPTPPKPGVSPTPSSTPNKGAPSTETTKVSTGQSKPVEPVKTVYKPTEPSIKPPEPNKPLVKPSGLESVKVPPKPTTPPKPVESVKPTEPVTNAKDAADAAKKAKDAKDAADAAKKAKDAKDAKDAADAAKKAKDAKDAADAAKKAKDAKDAKDAADAAKKAKDTAKKQEPAPTAPPSATPAPPVVKPPVTAAPVVSEATKTAVKVSVATAGSTAVMSAIAGAEGGKNYDVAFGDVVTKDGTLKNRLRDPKGPIDPSTGKRPFLNLMTPEEWSEKTLGKKKKLTQMTLREVLEFQRYRNKTFPSSAAVGSYGLMVSVLFGKNYMTNPNGGLVKRLGVSMDDTLFDKDTQDKLASLLLEDNVGYLKKLGVPTTPGYQYMSWYIGAGGASAIWKAIQSGNGDKKVGDILTAAKIDWAPNVNPELGANTFKGGAKNTAENFSIELERRLKEHGGLQTHMGSHMGAVDVSSISVKAADMRKSLSENASTQPVIMNNTTNVLNRETTVSSNSDKGSDNPQYKRQ